MTKRKAETPKKQYNMIDHSRGGGGGGGELPYEEWDKNVYINFINTFSQPKQMNEQQQQHTINRKRKKRREGVVATGDMPCFEMHSVERAVIQKLSRHNKDLLKQKDLLKKQYEALKKQHELAMKSAAASKTQTTLKDKKMEKLKVEIEKWKNYYSEKENEVYRMEGDFQKQTDQAQKEMKRLYKEIAMGESEIEVARNDVRRNSLISIQDVQRYRYLLQLEKQKNDNFQRLTLENELAQHEANDQAKLLKTLRKRVKEQEKTIVQLQASNSRMKYDLKNAKEELNLTSTKANSLEKKIIPLKAENKRVLKMLANYKKLFKQSSMEQDTASQHTTAADFLQGTDLSTAMDISIQSPTPKHHAFSKHQANAGHTPMPGRESPNGFSSLANGLSSLTINSDKVDMDFHDNVDELTPLVKSPNNIHEMHSQFASIISEPSPASTPTQLTTSFPSSSLTLPTISKNKKAQKHITATHQKQKKRRTKKKYNFKKTNVYDDMNPPEKIILDTSIEPYKKPLTHTSPKNATHLSKSQMDLLQEMDSETSSTNGSPIRQHESSIMVSRKPRHLKK